MPFDLKKKDVPAVTMLSILVGFLVCGCTIRVTGQNPTDASRDVRSESFEIRYVSENTEANGETDFKGETAIFDTNQRIEFLRKWATYGKRFFDNPQLDQKIYDENRVQEALDQLKSPPKPEVRTEIPLDDWKYVGYRNGQRKKERKIINLWNEKPGTRVKKGSVHINDTKVRRTFDPQTWRAHFWWEARAPETESEVAFQLSNAVEAGFGDSGFIYYITDGERVRGPRYKPGQWYSFKVELDLGTKEGRYNLQVNDRTVADFVPLARDNRIGRDFYPKTPFENGGSYLTFLSSGHYADVGVKGLEPEQGTVEFWFNLHGTPSSYGDSFLFGHVYPRTEWANRIYLLNHSKNGFGIRLGDSERVSGIFRPDQNRWYHVALVWERGKYHVYVNGERVKSGTYSGLEDVGDIASIGNIGHEQKRKYTPAAHIDEVRIWDHARGKEQIQKKSNQRLTGDEPGLVSYWPLNADQGEQLVDAAGQQTNARKHGGSWRGEVRSVSPSVNTFSVHTADQTQLKNLRVTSFGPKKNPEGDIRNAPYYINTIVQDTFEVRPDPEGFSSSTYDDSGWKRVPYRRYAHGGERNAGEHLYLRKEVDVDEFERAVLDIETVRPSGDLFVNGQHVTELNRHPARVNVSDVLEPDTSNVIAMRVDPHDVEKTQFHMSVDTHSSWFAGLTTLELTRKHHIKDVFARTTDLGNPANLRIDVDTGGPSSSFQGHIIARAYPWYPEESERPAGKSTKEVNIEGRTDVTLDLKVQDPELWTVEQPHLYKVQVMITDGAGNPVDDHVTTTGIRTVSQEGGTFRINGKPTMLNGPLIFGHYAPIERIAQWMFSPPIQKYVQLIRGVRRMNGNVMRMSIHDGAINTGLGDRRLARIGDQLGMMFIWQTPAWIRVGDTSAYDFEGLPKYAKNVRNHPSIVTWQPGNHPMSNLGWETRVFHTLLDVDRSRLISPSAMLNADRNAWVPWQEWPEEAPYEKPWWNHQRAGRGNMEQTTAYGKDWTVLRRFATGYDGEISHMPDRKRIQYLNSNTHAFFDYESEESISQANWRLHRGEPYYRMHSYEHGSDKGSIGRQLTLDEWPLSQAWQALTAAEAYRKKRWLRYDGMNWVPFRGGGNTATYKKPLVDYKNHAKLTYHAVKMRFQKVVAGSKNVDLVYGPDDNIPLFISNIGEAKDVDLDVEVKTIDGTVVAEKTFADIHLSGGHTVTDVADWRPDLPPGRYYGFEYTVR